MSNQKEILAEVKTLIEKYGLENAVKHKGKADPKKVMQKIMVQHPKFRKHGKMVKDLVEDFVQAINSKSIKEQKKKLEKLAPELLVVKKETKKRERGLPPLEGAEKGKVLTRYAPEPNGEMHLGHAFTAFFAHYYAEKYDGHFILRFEDTNPKQERVEYMDAHREALKWLELNPSKEVIVSNDMKVFYEKAEELIGKKLAYTCSCSSETIRELRMTEKACEHREKTAKETMADWKKMLAGDFDEGEIILRFRGDMQSKNAVMRDPAIATIRKGKHCLHGTKYTVWPLYDFAVAIEDYLCGITHVGRSAEFDSRIELQNTIREVLGLLPQPKIFHYARFNVIGSPASKRLIRPLVEEGKVEGWDDIRLVTIKGLERRGIIPEAIKELALEVGMTTQPTNIDWSLISATNRKLIDAEADRYFFVPNPVVLFVKNAPRNKTCKLSLHPDRSGAGDRTINYDNLFLISREDYEELAEQSEFRLKDLYNVKLLKKKITAKALEKHLRESKAKIKDLDFLKEMTICFGEYVDEELKPGPKIQWVVANPKQVVTVQVRVPDVLFINETFNENSLELVDGFAEKGVSKLKVGDIIQFERFGFVRVDSKKEGVVFVNLAHK